MNDNAVIIVLILCIFGWRMYDRWLRHKKEMAEIEIKKSSSSSKTP